MSVTFLRKIALRKIRLTLRSSSRNTQSSKPRQCGSPIITLANMVGVMTGVITVACIIIDMIPTIVAVRHPYPLIGVTSTGYVTAILIALISVIDPPHYAHVIIPP